MCNFVKCCKSQNVIVDLFGSGEDLQDDTEESGIWSDEDTSAAKSENTKTENASPESKDDDDINSEDIDDLFG